MPNPQEITPCPNLHLGGDTKFIGSYFNFLHTLILHLDSTWLERHWCIDGPPTQSNLWMVPKTVCPCLWGCMGDPIPNKGTGTLVLYMYAIIPLRGGCCTVWVLHPTFILLFWPAETLSAKVVVARGETWTINRVSHYLIRHQRPHSKEGRDRK